MKLLRCMVFVVTMAMVIGSASTAFAQQADALAGNLLLTTSTGATTAGIGGGVLLTLALSSDDDAEAQLEIYMRENAVAMQHDLHVGGGDTVRDLASAFGVPSSEMESFAQILHHNRDRLAPLAAPGAVNETSAQAFGDIVIREMSAQGVISMPDGTHRG